MNGGIDIQRVAKPRLSRHLLVLVVIFVIVVILPLFDAIEIVDGFSSSQVVFTMLFGWIGYVGRIAANVPMRWGKIGGSVALASLLLSGVHLFVRSLRSSTNGRWRGRWTAGFAGLFLFSLLSAMAMIGLVHQTVWIARLPKVFGRAYEGGTAPHVRCAANLKNFGLAIATYCNNHRGVFPDDLPTLMKEEELSSNIKICPAATRPNDAPATSFVLQTQYGRAIVSTYGSYIYYGKGLKAPLDPERIIMTEPWENHHGKGANALYADGHVEWLNAEHAAGVLPGLGFERISSPTESQNPPATNAGR